MFKLITGDVERSDPDCADRIYKFRHDFFVEHLRWEACRKPDGLERDQFDGPDCLHVVGEEREEIVSYARLLPTIRPHLQSDLYPEILQGAEAPTGPRIYEWTRHAVALTKREARGSSAFARAAFGAVAIAAEALDLQGLLVQTHPMLVDRLMDMGWDVVPLALPSQYEGAILLPIFARLTDQTLAIAHSALTDLGGARLHVPPAPMRQVALH
ncbi:acyl-homoserine-lactone synthase [Methylobacterium fujisawaense]|uniref:acyl-homoserine-lactone synthase n=1 Tax=Methylobacterium fujisawaense TaxID=107400 RepID=UPI0037036D56